MARKGNPILVRISHFFSESRQLCFFFLLLLTLSDYVLGLELQPIFVNKIQSMLLGRAIRFLFYRFVGWDVPLILLLGLLSGQEWYTLYMEDPAGGEGGAGSSRRPVDLNLPPGSGDELSDLVAELDQVEQEIRRLSEERIESGIQIQARQERLARLKTGLSEILQDSIRIKSFNLGYAIHYSWVSILFNTVHAISPYLKSYFRKCHR